MMGKIGLSTEGVSCRPIPSRNSMWQMGTMAVMQTCSTGELMDSSILGKYVEREVGWCGLGDLFLLPPLLVHLALLGA